MPGTDESVNLSQGQEDWGSGRGFYGRQVKLKKLFGKAALPRAQMRPAAHDPAVPGCRQVPAPEALAAALAGSTGLSGGSDDQLSPQAQGSGGCGLRRAPATASSARFPGRRVADVLSADQLAPRASPPESDADTTRALASGLLARVVG